MPCHPREDPAGCVDHVQHLLRPRRLDARPEEIRRGRGALAQGLSRHEAAGEGDSSHRQGSPARALDRLIDLYTATNEPDTLRKWQAERAKKSEAASMPGT